MIPTQLFPIFASRIMPDIINIRKGLDIPIDGTAELRLTDALNITTYAVKPTDFEGLVPRLLVAEGDAVILGDVLFCDKKDERIRFTSPVDGHVKAIVRGEKRKLLEVVVEADYKSASTQSAQEVNLPRSAADIKEAMLRWGLWPMLRQRPFGIIANPDDQPKAIFVSAFDSAPLAPDYDFMLQGREAFFAKGLEALGKLTDGEVHVCFRQGQRLDDFVPRKCSAFDVVNDAKQKLSTHYVKGPHPAGNVGTQIAKIDPINKGEVVWTMNAQDVAVLGELVSTGIYRPERVIAVAGPQLQNPHYYHIKAGACVERLLAGQLPHAEFPKIESEAPEKHFRIISGNVLSGTLIQKEGFVGAYDCLLSVLPEGDQSEFMGWLMPGVKKFSFSRTFLSGFMPKCEVEVMGTPLPRFKHFWDFNTNLHGEERAYVMTGEFEKVFPFDIYPLQLIKACIIGDIELMENLGIYEVLPEDFALCEFIDTSKTDIQQIIHKGLEKIRKELAN